jgi:hypothetical protein
MSPSSIASTILLLLHDAPGNQLSGAQLGNQLQKRLGHAPRALGIPKLKTFVREQLLDSVDIDEEGLLVTYRLKGGVARPATLPEPAHSPAPSAQDLFRIWKSPSVHLRLVVRRESGEVRGVGRDAEVAEGDAVLEAPTPEAHAHLAEEFVAGAVSPELQEAFRAKIDAQDPLWWRAWDELFQQHDLAALRASWLKQRRERLTELLREALDALGLADEARTRAFEQIVGSTRTARPGAPTQDSHDALRAALIATIERLPPEDLRQVWVPAGAFFDALMRPH